MQHHDAITGTHILHVGEDYSKIMKDSISHAIEGPLGAQIKQHASDLGIEIGGNITKCSVDGAITLNCTLDFNQT